MLWARIVPGAHLAAHLPRAASESRGTEGVPVLWVPALPAAHSSRKHPALTSRLDSIGQPGAAPFGLGKKTPNFGGGTEPARFDMKSIHFPPFTHLRGLRRRLPLGGDRLALGLLSMTRISYAR